MPAFIDLTDQKFHRLTVIHKDNSPKKSKHRNTKWICKCDCGKITSVDSYKLKKGLTKSCGCFKKDNESLDLTNQKFGRLTAVSKYPTIIGKQTKWLCRCKCGNEKIIETRALRSGATVSCGCYNREINLKKNTKHGYAKRGKIGPEYKAWTKIRQRCINPNDPYWKDYGKRGIKVCKRWLNSFENFYSDMGERPSKKHSIDRIDNDGDYTPENCRWATIKEQSNNTRRNIYITIDGVTKTLTQWCRVYGVNPVTANWRIKNGWPSEKAVKEPGNRNRPKNEY